MCAIAIAMAVTSIGLSLRYRQPALTAASLAVVAHRDAAAITFLVTLSGVTLGGVGSAFWGVVAGSVALGVQRYRTAAPGRGK